MNTKQILKNAGSNYGRTLVQLVVTLLLTPYTYRILGKEAFGIWALSQAIAGYFSLLDIGLTNGSTRYIAHYRALKDWDRMNRVIGSAMSCFASVGLTILLLSFMVAFHVERWVHISADQVGTLRLLIVNVGVIALIGSTTVVPVQCVIVSQRQDVLNLRMLGIQIFAAVATAAGLAAGGGVWTLALIQILNNLANGWFGYSLTRRFLPEARLRFGWDTQELKTALTFGGIIFLVTSAERLIFYSDTLVISHFLTVSLVAGYSIVLKIVEMMRSMVGAGAGVLGTFIQEQASLGHSEALGRIWLQCTRWSLMILFPITWVCLFCSDEVISSWLGQSDHAAAMALSWLAVAQLVDRGQVGAFQVLINSGGHIQLARIYLLEAILNLSLSIYLVQRFGLVGVAMGTTFPVFLRGLVFYPVLMFRLTRVPIRYYLWQGVTTPFIASLPFLAAAGGYRVFGLHTGRLSLIIMLAAGSALTLAAVWGICLTPAQRIRIKALNPRAAVGAASP